MSTVLVADDDVELLEMYEIWLSERPELSTRIASDGDEALSLLDESVDVAVLDRRMPTVTGDEVAREIDATYPECRVVIASAFEPDGNVDPETYDCYLTKPIGMEELVDAVASQLEDPPAPG